MSKRLMCALAVATGLLAPACAMAEPSAIYIVRHAEKASEGKDPGLTPRGQDRARNIAAILEKAGVTHVFSTATARTQATAQPLAERRHLPVELYDPAAPQALVDKVRALDGAVVVIGHSNTVPELVRRFGGEPGSDIGDSEYTRLYQLLPAAGKVHTVLLGSPPASPD
jgi:phosphohistidine phosphatase SixA